MKLKYAALAANLVMGVLVLVTWLRMTLQLDDSGRLSAPGLRSLKYFTVLSNLLLGISALIYAVYLILLLVGKRQELPQPVLLLKYAATVSVALTFLTVMLFLGPHYGYGSMFRGANLWFHLVIPLAAACSFCLLERDGALSLRASFFAVLPMVLYGVGYVINLLLHGLGEGKDTHDWYGFAQGGPLSSAVIFAVMILGAWGIALLLRLARK